MPIALHVLLLDRDTVKHYRTISAIVAHAPAPELCSPCGLGGNMANEAVVGGSSARAECGVGEGVWWAVSPDMDVGTLMGW